MPARPRFALELLEGRITPVSFAGPYGYGAGFNTVAVALGDVDNDGDLDMAAAAFAGGTSIKLNNGTGQFTDSANVNIGDPRSVALVDMDGDNKLDLVAANGSGFAVVIVRGNGDGTFANTITRSLPGGSLSAVVADLNEDGRPDVAVSSGDRVFVMLNDGSPNILGSPTAYITGTDTYRGTVGDFNDDGRLDLVLSGYATDRVDVLLNTGNGTFGPKTSYGLPFHGGGVATGDLNGDGRDDLAVTNGNGSGLRLYMSNPDGTLQSPTSYTPPVGNTDDVALVDVDRDGNLDVVARSFGVSRAIIWTGTGTGAVNAPVLAVTGLNPSGLALGDLNGDLLPDIVTSLALSPGSVTISLNTTPANFPPTITSNGGGATASVGTAENATAVTTVTASDAPGQTLTYSIAGGADALRFTIDPVTGALAFGAAPNFEAPADGDGDNVYEVIVQVSDGAGGTDTQTITVTVTDAPEPATITGTATGSVSEDGALTVGGTVTVSDPDAGQAAFQTPASLAGTYGTFTFDPATGVWGYTLNNALPAVQALAAGETRNETLTVVSLDGTATRVLTVVIVGAAEPVAAPPAPSVPPAPKDRAFAVGFGPGFPAVAALLNADGSPRFVVNALPGYFGGVSTAAGDVNGDGTYDLVVGAALNGFHLVMVFDGNGGSLTRAFFAFPAAGDTTSVAVADVNNDGAADIFVGPVLGFPLFVVYNGRDQSVLGLGLAGGVLLG